MNTQTMLLTKMVFLLKKLFPVLLIISLFFFKGICERTESQICRLDREQNRRNGRRSQ